MTVQAIATDSEGNAGDATTSVIAPADTSAPTID